MCLDAVDIIIPFKYSEPNKESAIPKLCNTCGNCGKENAFCNIDFTLSNIPNAVHDADYPGPKTGCKLKKKRQT